MEKTSSELLEPSHTESTFQVALKNKKSRGTLTYSESRKSEKSIIKSAKDKPVAALDKKKKKGKKKKQKVVEEGEIGSEFDIPGVLRLELPPLTQKILHCTVGTDVTAENPWKYISKEQVEDSIELHSESSVFLPIKKFVLEYPEKEILVGYIHCPERTSDCDLFHFVLTLEAKVDVQKILERQQAELQIRLRESIWKPIGIWKSLGSEAEINETQIQNFRPLFQIELQSPFPFNLTNTSFESRNVEDVRDGYVELLQDKRNPLESVDKKRVDACVQVSPNLVSHQSQTTYTFPTHAWTQYQYECSTIDNIRHSKDIKGTMAFITDRAFISDKIEFLDEIIYVNYHINMYINDYKSLVIKPRIRIDDTAELSIFKTYSEVKICKRKTVSAVSWNNFVSGLVAVSYGDIALSGLGSQEFKPDEVMSDMYGVCPVLIWDYTDELHPKLYLESTRQITELCFSPYRYNILVGACKNGQIIIWDIDNKLERVEDTEILTSHQTRCRYKLKFLLGWMKNTINIAYVAPCIISAIDQSHTDMVSSICWMPQDKTLTRLGKFEKIEGTALNEQFLTSSTDGTLLLWDINKKSKENSSEQKVRRKTRRFDKMPSALTVNLSKFASEGEPFKPIFKIIVGDSNKAFPIMTIMKIDHGIEYIDLHSTYNPNPAVRTYFKLSDRQMPSGDIPFVVSSTLGNMCKLSWEGYDYNVGHHLTSVTATTTKFQSVHDGPIIVCNKHAHFNIILTVGGMIFAIWILDEESPLVWRKCTRGQKYMAGGWTLKERHYALLIRSDGIFELWDFLNSSAKPIREVFVSGSTILDVWGIFTTSHCRKSTLGVSNCYGTFSAIHSPQIITLEKSDKEKFDILIEGRIAQKKSYLKWSNEFTHRYEPVNTPDKEDDDFAELVQENLIEHKTRSSYVRRKKTSEIEKMNKIFARVRWDNLQEKMMQDNLLQRKRLNLEQMKEQKNSMEKQAKENRDRHEKHLKYLSKKNKIINSAKASLFQGVTLQQRLRQYSLPHEMDDSVFRYIEDYDEILERSMNYITVNKFDTYFDWQNVISESKARRRQIEMCLGYVNIHDRYKNCQHTPPTIPYEQ